MTPPGAGMRMAGIRACVFDAYGTLFDVHSAVARHAQEIGPEAARLSELWRTKQLEYSWVLSLSGRYESFWSLTGKALDHALARCPSVDPVLKRLLLDAYRKLDAYPEVAAVLASSRKRGLRTAILSNGDPGMLAEASASAGIGHLLDAVLSVEAAGIFKTSPRSYQLALSALGLEARDIVFVSSNRWDVAGAAAFGFAPVWVNRGELPDEYPGLDPVEVATDLRALADAYRA
jgi:2-haloacid dehalogenase